MILNFLLATYLVTQLQGQEVIQKQISKEGEIVQVSSTPLSDSLKNKAATGLKVAIVGDTGCRVRGKEVQNCLDEKSWPLKRIAESIAKESPDLIIHVGDYHYRVSCKDSPLCPSLNSTLGYTWESWEAEWFAPTLAISHIPTVYVRGNHENCRRAWLHWEKYLAPGPVDLSECAVMDAFQVTDLGEILLVNLDVNWVSDEPLNTKEPSADKEKLKAYLEKVKSEIIAIKKNSSKQVWVLIHKPPYGAVPYLKKTDKEVPEEKSEKVSNKEIYWDFGTPRMTKIIQDINFDQVVDLYISGHIHNVQMVSGNHPLQIVAGESGTSLDPVGDYAKDLIPMINGSTAFIPTAEDDRFGYLIMQKKAKETSIFVKDPDGKLEFQCTTDLQTYDCKGAPF